MSRTMDNIWGLPTYPHFFPLFAIVIRISKYFTYLG